MPVFPAAGRESAARVPVPERMLSSRIRVTTSATPSGMTRVRRCLVAQRSSGFPFGKTTFRIAVGFV